MHLDSCRELKQFVVNWVRGAPSRRAPAAARAVAAAVTARAPRPPGLAIGIRRRKKGFALAVRIQESAPGVWSLVEAISEWAKREVDVRVTGPVHKQVPWHQRRNRPLRIGSSIGHYRITAGTLGAFVSREGEGGEEFILSNNHVLADENRAKKGDAILQPGKVDGGRRPGDVVGELYRFVRLKRRATNFVDCALARMAEDMEYYYNDLDGRVLRGVRTRALDEGEPVFKIGRTTRYREGYVSAIEVDNLAVGFDMGTLTFDNQIEIAPRKLGTPFSEGGDSGSLIWDGERKAVGLLFAGNDYDATFANPIGAVLSALDARLVY
ncbi:MAG: chymotrypsin family serine protease [Planctomycetota bacterium]